MVSEWLNFLHSCRIFFFGFKILDWSFFSFSIWKWYLLPSGLYDFWSEICCHSNTFNFFFLQVSHYFSLAVFKIFSLSLIFRSSIILSWHSFFEFILFMVHVAFESVDLCLLPTLGNFRPLFFFEFLFSLLRLWWNA